MIDINVNITKNVFNDVYLPYLNNQDRILIIYGGAGSGKSVFATQRYVYRLLKEDNLNLIVARKTARTNRDSTFALFKQIISKWRLNDFFKINASDMRLRCINGNCVIFIGLDDVEKIKSITGETSEISDIWVEEASEITYDDFKQLNIRLRGGSKNKQILLTLNPINILHWIKTELIDNGATFLKTTYKDNRFIDENYKKELESYKQKDPYYYTVYCLGEWGVLGASVFDAAIVSERINRIDKPLMTGSFDEKGNFEKETSELIKIYKLPQKNTAYVIGADTAGEGSDFFAAHVIDVITGEQTAVLHGLYDEDVFAKQVYSLAVYYNNALVGIEANFSSYPIKELERMGYVNQYVRMTEDTFTHKPKRSYGFKTTKITRPIIIAQLVKIVREHCELINDRKTLEEMLTFVRNEKGRAEAQNGAHDDLVMALAIAYYIREQQPFDTQKTNVLEPIYNFSIEKPKNDSFNSGKITVI